VNLTVLGATGSIGASTLDVVARHPDRYRVLALTAHAAAEPLLALCRSHRPRYAVLSGVVGDRDLQRRFSETGTELLFGAGALEEVVTHDDCQAVMASIVGAAGLPATLAAAAAGKRVLLANKEALVMAGPLFMRAAHEAGAFGRRKLAPSISPSKTWEGAAGGLLGTLSYAIICAAFVPQWGASFTGAQWAAYLAGTALLCAASIVGDLFESAAKRQAGVKDSGEALPGHGGILDRIDSATSTLPLAAALLPLMAGH